MNVDSVRCEDLLKGSRQSRRCMNHNIKFLYNFTLSARNKLDFWLYFYFPLKFWLKIWFILKGDRLARFITCFSYNYECRVSEKCNMYMEIWSFCNSAFSWNVTHEKQRSHLIERSNLTRNFRTLFKRYLIEICEIHLKKTLNCLKIYTERTILLI